jgi:hypothetical protein
MVMPRSLVGSNVMSLLSAGQPLRVLFQRRGSG